MRTYTVRRWIGTRRSGGSDCGKVEISTAALLEELFHTASRPLSTGFFLPRRRVEAPPAGLLPRPVVARLAEPEGDGWRVQVRSPWSSDREASVLVPGMRRPALLPGAIGLKTTGESAWISCTPAWRACCIAKSTASERGCT
ncbi:MAG: hypothetical protein ACLRWP_15675 [Bilophila wadsworthia]